MQANTKGQRKCISNQQAIPEPSERLFRISNHFNSAIFFFLSSRLESIAMTTNDNDVKETVHVTVAEYIISRCSIVQRENSVFFFRQYVFFALAFRAA